MSATIEFWRADEAWGAELARQFGRRASEVRYTVEGKGEPGTLLRTLHDAREMARMAWEHRDGGRANWAETHYTAGEVVGEIVGRGAVAYSFG